MSQDVEVVWKPFPGKNGGKSSQYYALNIQANVILYHGTRGPGKTDTQLMRFRKRVGIGYGSHWKGIILDREYKNLDDIVTKAKRWFLSFGDGCKFLNSKSDYKFVWPTGEELLLRAIKKADDYNNFHGHEYPFIGWNELTKYPTSELFDMMMSTNRSGFDHVKHNMPPIPLEVFATTNPRGPGHNWVKRRFIDVAPPGKVVRTKIEVEVPGSHGKIITQEVSQVAIKGHWSENPYLDPIYIAGLKKDKDEARRAAWLDGDWDVISGGALDGVWDSDVHVLPTFKIPSYWKIDRAFDWGSTHPFYVGWFAEANGEPAYINYNDTTYEFCPPKGTLILFYEWYGAHNIGDNRGIRMSAANVAKGILKREEMMMKAGLIQNHPLPGPADNQIYNINDVGEDSIADRMSREGVDWVRSNKRPGSRKNGLELVRNRFEEILDRTGKPGLYITRNCQAAIQTISVLPRDESDLDDVDTEAEDHPYDVIRYRVLHAESTPATKMEIIYA